MRGKDLLDAVAYIDPDLIEEAENRGVTRRPALWKRIVRAAAVFLLFAVGIGVLGLWLFVPMDGGEEALRVSYVQIGDRLALYTAVRTSRFDRLTLPYRTGELYAGSFVYRVKGSDNLAVLLREKGDGTLEPYRFRSFVPIGEDSLGWLRFAETDPPIDPDSLRRGGTYAFGEVLELIYSVNSPEEFAGVRFSKADFDRSSVGKRVSVDPVSVKDAESLGRIWDILRRLVRAEEEAVPAARIGAESPAYLDAMAPLSIQTDREVTVRLKNGEELRFLYSPGSGTFSENMSVLYEPIEEADNRWLTELAEIDTAWRDWGTNPLPFGAETAVPEKPG